MNAETDDRGIRLDSAWYPHTMLCFRRGMSLTNPQACDCGGNELVDSLRKNSTKVKNNNK